MAEGKQHATALMRYVEDHIARGAWKPGDRLPTERELSQRFGLSRNTLRKPLKELERRGLITRRIGSGSYVSDASAAGAAHRDAGLPRLHGASPAEVMEFRIVVEPGAIDLVVARATAQNFARMEECLQRSEAARSVAEFEHWDGALHLEIVAAARNQLLTDVYDALNGVRQQAEWGRLKERSLTPARRRLYEAQHRAIVAALQSRDVPAATKAVVEHLGAVREGLFGRA